MSGTLTVERTLFDFGLTADFAALPGETTSLVLTDDPDEHTVVIEGVTQGEHISGGNGFYILRVVAGLGVTAIEVDVISGTIKFHQGPTQTTATFAGFEFFRGSAGSDHFWSRGEGHRFEGGDRQDYFTVSGTGTVLDIVDYGGECGENGIVVNLGIFIDLWSGPATHLPADLVDVLVASMGEEAFLGVGTVSDTYRWLDTLVGPYRVEGSGRADLFIGGADADEFFGDGGDDHFLGGGGDDRIEGGDGNDTLYVAEGASVTWMEDGSFSVISADGTVTVTEMEFFRFADGALVAASEIPAGPIAIDDSNVGDMLREVGVGVTGHATTTGNVRTNDSDPNPGDTLSVSRARAEGGTNTILTAGTAIAGTYGTLTIGTTGQWSYVLNNADADTQALAAGVTVQDSFIYTLTDGQFSGEGRLDISIEGSNDAPGSAADTLSVKEDAPLTTTIAALLANDTDPEGQVVSLVSVQGAVNGGVARSGDGIVFTPKANFGGAASYTYTVQDAGGATATHKVNVAVTAVNDAPNGAGSTVTLAEDTTHKFALSQFGYSDVEGHALREIIVVSLPSKGMLKLGSATVAVNQVITAAQVASLTWTPPANANGTGFASFTFKVRDTGGGSDTDLTAGTIRFNVTPVNDAPVITTKAGSGAAGTITLNEGVATATAIITSDRDSSAVTLSLAGEDAGDFVIVSGQLRFRAGPDFETPLDANKNNVYKVTIRALDNGSGAVGAKQDMTITVKNVQGNTVAGDSAANTLDKTHKVSSGKFATAEEDSIDGKGGNDTINAAEGNDTLIGGTGLDRLTGGAGADRFVFNVALNGSNVDTITDFAHDVDRIALDDAIFSRIGAALDAGEFYAANGASSAHDASDRIIYNIANGRLHYDADGTLTGALPIHFATLSNKPLLDAGDFMVV